MEPGQASAGGEACPLLQTTASPRPSIPSSGGNWQKAGLLVDSMVPEPAPYIDWSSLPEGILMSIADFIVSFQVLTVFASVCHSWRTAALAAYCRPPLLKHSECTAAQSTYRQPPLLLKRGLCQWSWQVHDPASPSTSSRCSVSFQMPPSGRIISVCHGHLIVAEYIAGRSCLMASCFRYPTGITIVNPLSGEALRCPPIPPTIAAVFPRLVTYLAALLLNSSTLLVLISSKRESYSSRSYDANDSSATSVILQWPFGSEEWASGQNICPPKCLQRVGAFADGRLYAASRSALYVLRLEPQPTLVELAPLPLPVLNDCYMENHALLVNCGGELVYLRLLLVGSEKEVYVRAFCLKEPASAAPEWVRMESLGDWAIFVSPRSGVPALACRSPGSWGGRAGCIYFAKSGLLRYSSGNAGDWHVVDAVDGATGIYYDDCCDSYGHYLGGGDDDIYFNGRFRELAPELSQVLVAPTLTDHHAIPIQQLG